MIINEFNDYSLVKHLISEEYISQTELWNKMCDKRGKKTTLGNFSKKLKEGHLRFRDLKDMCEILGYNIILEKKK